MSVLVQKGFYNKLFLQELMSVLVQKDFLMNDLCRN